MCNLSKDTIEHEQKGVRPCLVISVDVRNSNSSNVFIFPITHAKKKEHNVFQEGYDTYIAVSCIFNEMLVHYKENIVLCEEGRSISKNRLQRKIGIIFSEDINNILKCKEYVFIEKTI